MLFVRLPPVRSLKFKEGRVPNNITALKASDRQQCRSFIVADIETVLLNDIHVPYAAGYLVVNPGDDLTSNPITTFFSEDHIVYSEKFEERSERMLELFLYDLELYMKSNVDVRTVYFHNFARFDGIFILKYFADQGDKYKINLLLRNSRIYELKIHRKSKNKKSDKYSFILRFRDSLMLLPSSLDSLSKALCPELGSKGELPHRDMLVDKLLDHKDQIMDYLRQDILLLGGVMKKAQEMNWSHYSIDIENVMTVSALSMRIFRMKYFVETQFQINIPTRNQDSFIRRDGGHVDVYKPCGSNLHYYDVNSLYPYVMKKYPMPSGVPVWHNSLKDRDLDDIFGFVEAYVVCPTTIEHPFLPYKEDETLIFPTGRFVGVYYTEELKFARNLGYEIFPLRGYLFEKKDSPFDGIISDLYNRRLEAKKRGDAPMTYLYKILMNSLYGRFGLNPESTLTEICNKSRFDEWIKKDNFKSGEKLNDQYYLVSYSSNCYSDDEGWKAPKMSAVHLAAAITACARIHMYPHIARSDCYYTDTDSVVLGSPISDDLVSSTELGMFKHEYHVKKAIFLAPKSYWMDTEEVGEIIKHKGPTKDSMTAEWFQELYDNPSKTKDIAIDTYFRIDWKKLSIGKKSMNFKLGGLSQSTKRVNVYDANGNWVCTRPKNVIDIGTQDVNTIFKYELEKKRNVRDFDEVLPIPDEGEPDNRLLDMTELEDDEDKNSITEPDSEDDHSIIEPDDSEPDSPNMDITDRRYEDDTTNHKPTHLHDTTNHKPP